MKIFIAGDDARMNLLRNEAQARGHTLTDAAGCDIAALQLPDSNQTAQALSNITGYNRRAAVGRLSPDAARGLEEKGWRLIRPQADACYTRLNALLSAEGAICCLMQKINFALRGARCCVIGYGRIGAELTRLLSAFGARVAVAARRAESREDAEAAGALAAKISALRDILPAQDCVINTVPARVLDENTLRALRQGAIVMDLAAPPYGLDFEAAARLRVNAHLESGIPARYAPLSAARLLMDYLEAGD